MVREEPLYTVPERLAGGSDARLGKSKKITKISCDPSLHPLGGSLVDDHVPLGREGFENDVESVTIGGKKTDLI